MQHQDTTKATAYLTDSPLAGLGTYLYRNLVLRFSLGRQAPGNLCLSLEALWGKVFRLVAWWPGLPFAARRFTLVAGRKP